MGLRTRVAAALLATIVSVLGWAGCECGVAPRAESAPPSTHRVLTVGLNAASVLIDGVLWCWGGREATRPHECLRALDAHDAVTYLDAACFADDAEVRCSGLTSTSAVLPVEHVHRGPTRALAVGAYELSGLSAYVCGISDAEGFWCWSTATGMRHPVAYGQGVRWLDLRIISSRSLLLLDEEGHVFWAATTPTPELTVVALPESASLITLAEPGGCALGRNGTLWCGRVGSEQMCPRGQTQGDWTWLAGRCGIDAERSVSCFDTNIPPCAATQALPTPRPVPLPSPAVDLSELNGLACALLTTAEVWCWGDGQSGGLGDPSIEFSEEPVRVVLPWAP